MLEGAAASTAQTVPVVAIQVCGPLDVTSAPQVSQLLLEALSLRPQRLVVDLAQCTMIDAAGILLLLDTHRRATREGSAVALLSPSERVQRNLRLAKVDRVLTVIRAASDAPAEVWVRS